MTTRFFYLWHGKFINAKTLRKKLSLNLREFRRLLATLEERKIIKTHYGGYGTEKHHGYGGHSKIICVKKRDEFFRLCELYQIG